MKTIEIIYAGVRLIRGKKNYFYYQKDQLPEVLKAFSFSSKLARFEQIGAILTTDTDDFKTFRNHKIIGMVEESEKINQFITDWSIEERIALEEWKVLREGSKKHSAHVDSLINELKESIKYMSNRDKSNIIGYIIHQLSK